MCIDEKQEASSMRRRNNNKGSYYKTPRIHKSYTYCMKKEENITGGQYSAKHNIGAPLLHRNMCVVVTWGQHKETDTTN